MLFARVFVWCVCGYIAGRLAAGKGYPPNTSVALGILFGPIGLIAALILPRLRADQDPAGSKSQSVSTDTSAGNGTDALPHAAASGTVRLCAVLVAAGLFLACFTHVIFLERNFAFRDVGHFYHPLFRYIQQEWSAGRLPMWNPYDNCGTPLIASATSSVFYPGKLVFFLPIPFDSAFKLFVLGHFVLSFAGVWLVGRRWGQSDMAAALAALSYAFGGSVLFQYSNVPFLCGAAWLPFGLLAGERVLNRPDPLWIAALGGVLAMMVLAGDPQAGYHTGILMMILWLIRLTKRSPQLRTCSAKETDVVSNSPVTAGRQLVALIVAAVVGASLSCIQLLPSLEYVRQSERATGQVPRSLWEIPAYVASGGDQTSRPDTGKPPGWFDTLAGDPPPPAKHYSETFSFSILPIRLSECLVPNVGGAVLPGETRLWTLAGERGSDVWIPSLYFGLLPCLLAVSSLRLLRGPLLLRWLTWSAVLFVLGSFGRYGPGYLLSSTDSQATRDMVGGLGGIYWLFVVLLPGYAAFRYPAKLWTVAALALSLVAGFGWDSLDSSTSGRAAVHSRLRRFCGLLLIVGAAGLLLTLAVRPTISEEQRWGGMSADAVAGDLIRSFTHLTIAAGSVLWVFRRQTTPNQSAGMRRQVCLLALVAVDLGIAHSWFIVSAPEDLWRVKPATVELVESLPRSPDLGPLPRRAHVTPFLPVQRRDDLEAREGADVVKIATLLDLMESRLHLPWRVQKVWNHQASVQEAVRQVYFDHLPLEQGRVIVRPRRAFDLWGVELFVTGSWPEFQPMPYEQNVVLSNTGLRRRWDDATWNAASPLDSVIPQGRPLPVPPTARTELAKYNLIDARENVDAVPPVRIVREVELRPPISHRDRPEWLPILISVNFPVDQYRDLRRMAVVEDPTVSDGTPPKVQTLGSGQPSEDECQVLHYEPGRVVLNADLETSGLLVLAETYAPGWTVEVASEGQKPRMERILRTNLAMRGVMLEAGSHRLEFRYCPASVYIGAVVSVVACLGVILLLVFRFRATRRKKRGSHRFGMLRHSKG